MARLALVFSGGAALAFLPGSFSLPALAALLTALTPIRTSRRPSVRAALVVAMAAGLLGGWMSAGPHGQAWAPGSVRGSSVVAEAGWAAARREALDARIVGLYGSQAPLVSALTLARREGLSPGLREDFARSGTAHLLAISGFHVGVVAGVLLVLLRGLGLRRARAGLAAAVGAGGYVAFLGFPDAASRAALILLVVAAARARGRPAARWGGLGAALMILVALDPGRLTSAGFQLSFAGAAGLAAWAGPLGRRLRQWLPGSLATSVAAGVAATAATLPIVAWHFERISLMGIPATLLATPLVVVALPGALLSLVVHAVSPPAGAFLAGGVGLILTLLERGTHLLASPSWASLWVPRSWVTVAVVGAWMGRSLAPRASGGRWRRAVVAAGAVSGIVIWPALLAIQARGRVEVVMVDVGQGDAVAVRTPAGRWVLVDAGPPWRGPPGGAPVIRTLRRMGVRRLETLVLTHPDLDHIGGAPGVLRSFAVDRVLDPGTAVGKPAYLELLQDADARGIPWRRARAGDSWQLDGVTFSVLHSGAVGLGEGGDTEANDLSVVLSVAYGDFDVLLTGDAPVAVEEGLLPLLSTSLEVLKVGHHGSGTSTGPALVARTHPRVALVSVGRWNRYGHPQSRVLERLEAAGSQVRRTDEEGTVRVVGGRDGVFQVYAEGATGR